MYPFSSEAFKMKVAGTFYRSSALIHSEDRKHKMLLMMERNMISITIKKDLVALIKNFLKTASHGQNKE